MKFILGSKWPIIAAAGVWIALGATVEVQGQLNPFAPTSAIDTLSGGQVGSATGNLVLQRARALPQTGGAAAPTAPPLGAPQAPAVAPPGALGQAQAGALSGVVPRALRPRIKAIAGERVFDAVTGELLDDARIVMIDESQKDSYYDDGTNGDVTAEDGIYARVTERRDVLGQSSQRIKERLIQALHELDLLDPIEFYGHSILTTEKTEHAPRNRRWKIVEAEGRSLGFRLVEIATEKPLVVPKYREQQSRKDAKLRDEYAVLFLEEYRKEKKNLHSEFYPLYIPRPPTPPSVPPPPQNAWIPFPTPAGEGGTTRVPNFAVIPGFGR